MERYALITYDISKLEQKRKMQLIRKLNGYDSIKKGRIERKPGLLQQLKAKRFGINTILVQFNNKKTLEKLFAELKASTESITIYM